MARQFWMARHLRARRRQQGQGPLGPSSGGAAQAMPQAAGLAWLAALVLFIAGALVSAPEAAADRLYWADKDSNAIQFAELADFENTVTDLAGTQGTNTQCGVAFDLAAGKIYWANDDNPTGTIRRANLDGSDAETLPISPALQAPCALVVDPENDKLYWTDVNSNTLRVADRDGSNSQVLVGPAGNDHPAGLALDKANGKIYWTNEGTPGSGDAGLNDAIRVADLNPATNDAQDLIPEGNPHTGGPLGLAIDPVANKIYWSNCGSDTIEVADLDDGSNPQTIVDLPGAPTAPTESRSTRPRTRSTGPPTGPTPSSTRSSTAITASSTSTAQGTAARTSRRCCASRRGPRPRSSPPPGSARSSAAATATGRPTCSGPTSTARRSRSRASGSRTTSRFRAKRGPPSRRPSPATTPAG